MKLLRLSIFLSGISLAQAADQQLTKERIQKEIMQLEKLQVVIKQATQELGQACAEYTRAMRETRGNGIAVRAVKAENAELQELLVTKTLEISNKMEKLRKLQLQVSSKKF